MTNYTKVRMLIIQWEADDLNLTPEHEALRDLLVFGYKWEVEIYMIPIDEDIYHISLQYKILQQFARYQRKDELLVVMYGGHGGLNEDKQMSFSATKDSIRFRLDWAPIQEYLQASISDVLLILDCCHAGAVVSPAWSGTTAGSGRFEIIAACEEDQTADSAGPYVFTTLIIKKLRRALKIGRTFSVEELYRELATSTFVERNRYVVIGESPDSAKGEGDEAEGWGTAGSGPIPRHKAVARRRTKFPWKSARKLMLSRNKQPKSSKRAKSRMTLEAGCAVSEKMFLLPIKPVHILIAGEDERSIQLSKMTQFMQPSSTDSTETWVLPNNLDYMHYLFEPEYQEVLDQFSTSLSGGTPKNVSGAATENVTIVEDSASPGYIDGFASHWFGDSDGPFPPEDISGSVPEWEVLYDDLAPSQYNPPSDFSDWGSIRIGSPKQVSLDQRWEIEEIW